MCDFSSMVMASLIKYVLHAKHCCKLFTCMNSFILHNDSMSYVLLLLPIYGTTEVQRNSFSSKAGH